jgi:hypothetical protein
MASTEEPAQPLQEALNLVKLPSEGQARRFMSTRAAYLPGSDYTAEYAHLSAHKAAFGGHVYAQAALAVARAWREMEDEKGSRSSERLDIHVSPAFNPLKHQFIPF